MMRVRLAATVRRPPRKVRPPDRCCLESGADILRSPYFKLGDFEAEGAGRNLDLSHLQHGLGKTDVRQDRHPAQIGTNLAQKFEPLAGEIVPLIRYSSDVTARSR